MVVEGKALLGVIELKDTVKPGMRERFDQMRAMGIRTVMITGDNPLTAASIAAEAGVDDFMAEATPEDKMDRIRAEQAGGNLVAMTGDGTNDAPALALADVGVAMNTGTQAAKEAGNMVDLDSDPRSSSKSSRSASSCSSHAAPSPRSRSRTTSRSTSRSSPPCSPAVFPALDRLNVMNLRHPARRSCPR